MNGGDSPQSVVSNVSTPLRVSAATLLLPAIVACGDTAAYNDPPSVLVRDSAGITVVENGDVQSRPEGTALSSLGEHEGRETLMRVGAGMVAIIFTPFARGYAVAPGQGGVIISPNDRLELRTYRPDGPVTRIVRLDESPRPVTEEDLALEEERRIAAAPEQARADLRAAFHDLPTPDSMPAFEGLLTDPTGNTWEHLYRPPVESGPEKWVVVDPVGTYLGTVETPEGLTIYEIGEDYVLGRVEDELEVEHVQMWPLRRDRS